MRRQLGGVVLCGVLSLLVACGVGRDNDESVAETTDPLVGATLRYWPSGPAIIPVCFESTVTPTVRTRVQQHVEQTWQRFARVTFTGWNGCTAGAAGLHVNQRDFQTSTSPIGTQGNGGLNGEVINFDSFDDTPDGGRFAYVVGHEFGHALGFHHEECRAGYTAVGDRNLNSVNDQNEVACMPIDCSAGKPVENWPNRSYGYYDVLSIMSSCGRYSNLLPTWSVGLSPNDIASVQTVYGRKASGQVVSTQGNCISMPGASQGIVLDCTESSNRDKLRYNATSQTLSIDSSCLESSSAGSSATVFMYPTCDGYSGQVWKFESVFVRGWGGMCIDLENGNIAGGRAQLFDCGAVGGANQRWTYTTSGEVRFGGPGSVSCMTATAANEVRVQTCTGASNQKFDFLSTGQLRVRSSSLCVDVSGPTTLQYSPPDGSSGIGLPASKAGLQVYTCIADQMNQRFNLSGPIKHGASGTCLERSGESDGALLRRAPCNGGTLQTWDYYPL